MDQGQVAVRLLEDVIVWLASCTRAQADLGPATARLSDIVEQLLWPGLQSLGGGTFVRPADLVAAHNSALRQALDVAAAGSSTPDRQKQTREMTWPPPEFPRPPLPLPEAVPRVLTAARLPPVPALPPGLAGEALWEADVERAVQYVRGLVSGRELDAAPLLSAVSATVEQSAAAMSWRNPYRSGGSAGHAVPWPAIFEAIAVHTLGQLRREDPVVEYDPLTVEDIVRALPLPPRPRSPAYPEQETESDREEEEEAVEVAAGVAAGTGKMLAVVPSPGLTFPDPPQKRKRRQEGAGAGASGTHKQQRMLPLRPSHAASITRIHSGAQEAASGTSTSSGPLAALSATLQAEKAASQDFESLLAAWCSEGAPATLSAGGAGAIAEAEALLWGATPPLDGTPVEATLSHTESSLAVRRRPRLPLLLPLHFPPPFFLFFQAPDQPICCLMCQKRSCAFLPLTPTSTRIFAVLLCHIAPCPQALRADMVDERMRNELAEIYFDDVLHRGVQLQQQQ